MIYKIGVAVLTCAALTIPATAQDKKSAQPDPKAYGEAMMKAGAVGENHKKLEPLVGSFAFVIKMWMDPSKPPEVSNGTSESKWIMGGRYIQQEVKGEFGGMPFNGMGLVGYDNLKKSYVSTWVDNMSTSIMNATGQLAKDGKGITYTGEEIDPLSGQTIKVRDVTTFVDANTIKTVFYKTVGKDEVKVMEIVSTRIRK